jgi:hypothetical protein
MLKMLYEGDVRAVLLGDDLFAGAGGATAGLKAAGGTHRRRPSQGNLERSEKADGQQRGPARYPVTVLDRWMVP